MNEQYATGLKGALGSTDNALLRADGTGGKSLQGSTATLSDGNCLTLAGGTVTASAPLLNLSQTWNNAGVPFTALTLNVTDTASASESLLVDFKVGGSSKFSVDKTGAVNLAGSVGVTSGTLTTNAPGVSVIQTWNNAANLFYGVKIEITPTAYTYGSRLLEVISSGQSRFYVQHDKTNIYGPCFVQASYLSVASYLTLSSNIYLYGDAANTLAQRNGVNAQIFNIYNTYTSGSVYERAELSWASNLFRVFTSTAGGTQRNLAVGGASLQLWSGTPLTQRWNIDSSGHLVANANNTYDIGQSGANCPRHIYAGTDVVSPKFVATSPQTYVATNVSTDRSYDANATTLDELADIVGTLISDLQTLGLVA